MNRIRNHLATPLQLEANLTPGIASTLGTILIHQTHPQVPNPRSKPAQGKATSILNEVPVLQVDAPGEIRDFQVELRRCVIDICFHDELKIAAPER